jgi:hypothetical protein
MLYHRGAVWVLAFLCLLELKMSTAATPSLPSFDFTRAEGLRGWEPTHDVSQLRGTSGGLEITISGWDPYIHGPARDYPAGTLLWLTVRLKSAEAGTGQIFYFRTGATEENSVRFPVRAGSWQEIRLPLPALGPGYRLRFDPPGTRGKCVLGFLRAEPRAALQEPAWPQPVRPEPGASALSVRSGDLQLAHDGNTPGGFVLQVAGEEMAVGLTRSLIGYVRGEQTRWVPLGSDAAVTARSGVDGVTVTTSLRDPDGATWRIEQRFAAGDRRGAGAPGTGAQRRKGAAADTSGRRSTTPGAGAIDIETRVTVNQERQIIFLPMLVLLPGAGSFGAAKGQGLFAGLEYLDNEPSSSEADVIGPASKRQVPDSLKITFPLMAIQARDRYVGLIWRQDPAFSALFDSPDRLFHSGGHVMGILAPGSDGQNRVEGSLLPYQGERLPAGKALALAATLIGGRGKSVVPAVQQYVRLRGLPPTPAVGMDDQGYLALAAHGWLDSKIREGGRFRHAASPGFDPQPAADAAVFMDWLARQTNDAGLSTRLTEASRAAIGAVAPEEYETARVSHVFYPVASLIYGRVAENARRAAERGWALLGRFEPDGTVLYRPEPNKPDYGKTHFARDANGLTAQVVASLLETAAVSGDPQLLREGLRVLRALDRFADSVPRGAQTWEVPLHTPDILASAYLVRAYTQGYELTGEARFLDQARYWAWTGVPFLYLTNPTGQPVGPYATIAVLGATNWSAPVWIGHPVQWCGLVYADALYRLAPYDADAPWKQLADGIAASGIQQSWPRSNADWQGLLPDSYNLRNQLGGGPPINPGTVMANAIRLFRKPALYDFHAFRASGLLVHAPGAITDVREEAGRVSFTVDGWLDRPYRVLVAGLKQAPQVQVDGREATTGSWEYVASEGRLVLTLQGRAAVEIVTR